MKLEFDEYEARKVVNVHKHVDGGWFWHKYGSNPYVGCRSGCEFCYARGGRYAGRRGPEVFDKVIRVKTNVVELLRKELGKLEPDIITCGDWQQPAESRYGLSRKMLEVVLEFGFPLVVIERSPLLIRDLDLLQEINRKAHVGVILSFSNVDPALKRAFEPRSPGLKRRLAAMAELAAAGIQVGAALMPIIPLVGDSEEHLDDAIRAFVDHGGSFIIGAGLTMEGEQARRTLAAGCGLDPEFEDRFRLLYDWEEEGAPEYGPAPAYATKISLRVRGMCAKHGIPDRMPRPIMPGPLAVNKRIAERLFLRVCDLELEQADQRRIWAYRRGAWTVDEWPESVGELHRTRGEAGLRELPGIGRSLSGLIARWLQEES